MSAIPALAVSGGSAVEAQGGVSPYPWMVAMQFGSVQKTLSFDAHQLKVSGQMCGGTLIGPSHVIVAAHCVTNLPDLVQKQVADDLYVAVGARDFAAPSGTVVKVASITVNPNYGGGNTAIAKGVDPAVALSNDAAILELATPVAGVTPVALAEVTPAPGQTGTVMGWGMTQPNGLPSTVLNKAELPVMDRRTCLSIEQAVQPTVTAIPDAMLCAGNPASTTGTCTYDSGGPLFGGDVQGQPVLYGVVNFNNGCAQLNNANVFADVANMVSWIRSVIDRPATR